MAWLLAGLIILTLVINIRSISVFSQYQQKKEEMDKNLIALHQVIEDFVKQMEGGNEELYQKLTEYVHDKESRLEERLHLVEVKLEEQLRTEIPEAESVDSHQKEKLDLLVRTENLNKSEKISKLYLQGFSIKQIAKILKIDTGEVELMINMLNRKKSHQK